MFDLLRRFRPPLWSTVLLILAVALFLKLGFWQLSRAEEKDVRFAVSEYYAQQPPVTIPVSLVKLDDYRYRRVEVRGYFEPEYTILLDNKIHEGIVGYHVLTPLRLSNSSTYVMVNRGWVAGRHDRSQLPDIPTPIDSVMLVGMAVPPSVKTLTLSDEQVAGKVWQNFDLDNYQHITGLTTFQPLLLLQQSDTIGDGLVRQWEQPDSGSSKNVGYAYQWFSFAVLALIIYLVLNVRKKSAE